jgi:hypothetical protein
MYGLGRRRCFHGKIVFFIGFPIRQIERVALLGTVVLAIGTGLHAVRQPRRGYRRKDGLNAIDLAHVPSERVRRPPVA